jgi:hypothetical protein
MTCDQLEGLGMYLRVMKWISYRLVFEVVNQLSVGSNDYDGHDYDE